MKNSAKQHETWVIAAAIVAFLATFAVALYDGVTPGVTPGDTTLPAQHLIALLTSSLTAMGVGGATLIKRSAQRGEQAGAAAAPAVEQIRSTIQDILAQERAAPDDAKLTLDDHKHPEHRQGLSVTTTASGEVVAHASAAVADALADSTPTDAAPSAPARAPTYDGAPAAQNVPSDAATSTTEPALTAPPPTDGARSGEQAGDG